MYWSLTIQNLMTFVSQFPTKGKEYTPTNLLFIGFLGQKLLECEVRRL